MLQPNIMLHRLPQSCGSLTLQEDTTSHPSGLAEARGEMWVNCQGQKWSAPQGMDGKYLGPLSHMVPAPKKHEHQSVGFLLWNMGWIQYHKGKTGGEKAMILCFTSCLTKKDGTLFGHSVNNLRKIDILLGKENRKCANFHQWHKTERFLSSTQAAGVFPSL